MPDPNEEKHLGGQHPGTAKDCSLVCDHSSCEHTCQSHMMGMKCMQPGCSCTGFARKISSEELNKQQFLSKKVTCLMITRSDRIQLAARAIKCFEKQSYPFKELLIVSDDDMEALLPELPHGARFLRAPSGLNLGHLRNYAIACSDGDYIAQWDDDDWYHPNRLTKQMNALFRDSSADGCTLGSWTIAWPARGLYGISHWRDKGWEGSLVARRWKTPIYPGLPRREDTPVVESMNLTVIEDPTLYVYVVHGSNTWNEKHFEMLFTLSKTHGRFPITVEETHEIKSALTF